MPIRPPFNLIADRLKHLDQSIQRTMDFVRQLYDSVVLPAPVEASQYIASVSKEGPQRVSSASKKKIVETGGPKEPVFWPDSVERWAVFMWPAALRNLFPPKARHDNEKNPISSATSKNLIKQLFFLHYCCVKTYRLHSSFPVLHLIDLLTNGSSHLELVKSTLMLNLNDESLYYKRLCDMATCLDDAILPPALNSDIAQGSPLSVHDSCGLSDVYSLFHAISASDFLHIPKKLHKTKPISWLKTINSTKNIFHTLDWLQILILCNDASSCARVLAAFGDKGVVGQLLAVHVAFNFSTKTAVSLNLLFPLHLRLMRCRGRILQECVSIMARC